MIVIALWRRKMKGANLKFHSIREESDYTIPDYASTAIVQLMFGNHTALRPPQLPPRMDINKNVAYGQQLTPGIAYGQRLTPGIAYGQRLTPGIAYGQQLTPGIDSRTERGGETSSQDCDLPTIQVGLHTAEIGFDRERNAEYKPNPGSSNEDVMGHNRYGALLVTSDNHSHEDHHVYKQLIF